MNGFGNVFENLLRAVAGYTGGKDQRFNQEADPMYMQATELVHVAEEPAEALYRQSRAQGRRRQLWSRLTGRSQRLLALEEIMRDGAVQARSYAGVHSVRIGQIRGSENRCDDFDRDFSPLQEHSKRRWLSIARARGRDQALPPVVLIQVGELYFVRDGHHRISVARALGQLEIEAEVTVWQVREGQSRETKGLEVALGVRRQTGLQGLLSGVGAHVRARLAPG